VPRLRFLDWTPDASDLGSPGNTVATNAVPSADGYQPFPQINIVTDALVARPRGALEAFDKDNTSFHYAGDAGNLYELDESDMTWTEVSKAATTYATGTEELWNFVRWENKVLCTNWNDSPQQITMGGANFTDLTTALKARNITVVRDFVVFSNTWDSSDGNVPNRVRWSAIGDETDYTVSAATLSDFRDLTTGGPIRGIAGGDVGIIISDRSIFRMEYVGAPTVFEINEILPGIGSAAPQPAIAQLGDDVYFFSQQGFIELSGNGTGVNRIGAGKVDKWFINDLDPDYYYRISAIADPVTNRIMWAYPGAGNTSGRPNKIIVYDRTFQRWALIEEEVEYLVRSKGIDVTLEELDALGFSNLDTMGVSLDSDQFKGKASQLSGFDESFKLGFFRGLNKTATLTTGERELVEGKNTVLTGFSPLVDSGTVTARVGSRRRQSDAATYTSSKTQNSWGRFTPRVNSRFFHFELTVSGDDWTDAIGVSIGPDDFKVTGSRA
jgi:hypothetical protein